MTIVLARHLSWCLTVCLSLFALSVQALSLTGVQSRKTHIGAGVQDLPIDRSKPMSGNVTVESRAIGAGHTIVFQFDGALASAGTLSVIDDSIAAVAGVSATPSGNNVVVNIPTLADNRRVTISLANVNGVGLNVEVSMGFRLGDTNNSGTVNAIDVSSVKARAGQTVSSANFQYDVDTTGIVTAADISALKARSGAATLPPGNSAPVVSAGTNQTITLPASATIVGTASDDGLPNPPATLSLSWSKFSGPGTVTFGNANAASTNAGFSVAGIYVLRLTASDSQRSTSANVTITVNPDITPTISGFLPVIGALVGQAVTINGTNFTGATAVSFNGTNQPVFTVATANQITTTVPVGATSGTISVTAPGGMATSASFTVIVLPTVVSTVPVNNATAIQLAATITVNFSETVNAGASAFTLECPVATPKTFTLAPLTAASSFTLTPTASLPAGTVCRVTVVAAQVTDVDTSQNMAANYVFNFTTGTPPAITSAASATFAPGKTGQTYSVTTTGAPANGITRTGTLPTGVTFTDNGNNTATIAGTPAAGTQGASPYAWVITAANSIIPNATQNFTFNVTCPVITVSGAIPALTFNTAMATATFTQAGGNGAISWSATGLPTGTTINSGSGQTTGTPNVTGTFSATITATDAGGCIGTANRTVTVAPITTGNAYSGLVDNTQFVLTGGATVSPATPFVGASGNIVANDLPSGGVIATAGTFATSAGGSVTIAADGTFIYTPKANPALSAVTSDSFTYTVFSNTGGGAAVTSAPGTVNLTLAGRAWYVLNNGAGANGQSQSPFLTLSAAVAASTVNDVIYVYQGSGTTTNLATASILKTGQSLIGQGVTLVVNGNTLIPAGGFPLIGNTVTLSTNSTVRGLNLSTGGATGLSGAGTTGVTVNSVSVATTTGTGVNVSNTTGTLSFTGLATAGGAGASLVNNTGATFTFTGVTVSSGTSAAFSATGGGTINVTGVTNTLTSTTGTALNVVSTTIGASGLVFRSISSNGATSGIILNATGASGGLTIVGNGGTCTSAATCTGGAIQNSTSDGVVLTSTQNPSFTRFNITDSAGTAADDGMLLTNVTGTVTIDNSTIVNSPHNGITVDNNNTNMVAFNFTNSTISCAAGQPCQPSGTVGNDGLLLIMRGTSVLTSGLISGSTFSGVRAVGVQIQTNDSGRIGVNAGTPTVFALSAANSFTVQGNTFTGNGQGVDIGTSQVSNLTFQVLNNTFNGKVTAPGAISNQASSHSINAFTAAGADTGPAIHSFVGKIDNNIIGTQGVKDSGSGFGNGIRVVVQGQTTQAAVTVSNNTIREVPNGTILNFFGQNGAAASGTNTARFNIVNNLMPAPSGSNLSLCGPANTACADTGIFILADEGTPVCNIITGNTIYDVSTMLGGSFNIYLAERAGPPVGAQLTVQGTGGSNSAYIQANNTLAGASRFVDEGGNTSQVAAGVCGTFPP